MSIFISSGCCAMLAWMILVLPLQWILPALTAAFFHEFCHYAAILLCTGETARVHLYSFAARIPLPEMGRGKELLCTLAGPVGGFLLMLFLPVFPRLALCGCVQSLYNLLPVYPLDGGRALDCAAAMLLPPVYAAFLCEFVRWLCVGAILMIGIYAAVVLKAGYFPLLAGILLVFRTRN